MKFSKFIAKEIGRGLAKVEKEQSLALIPLQNSERLPAITGLESKLTQQQTEALIQYYKPKKGRLSSWWQKGKSASRAELLKNLNEEQRLVVEQASILEQAVIEGRTRRADYELYIAKHSALFIELRSRSKLIEEAASKGLTLEVYQELQTEAGLTKLRMEESEHESNIKLNEERELSKIKVFEHERITEIDLDRELDKHREIVRLALLSSTMSKHQEIAFVQELMDLNNEQIDKIQKSNLSENLKARMIADREEILETLREDRRAKQARLSQDNNREEI